MPFSGSILSAFIVVLRAISYPWCVWMPFFHNVFIFSLSLLTLLSLSISIVLYLCLLAFPPYLKCRSKLCQRIITHFVTQTGGWCWKVQPILTLLIANMFSCHSGGVKTQLHWTFTLQKWYKSRGIYRLLAVRLPAVNSTHLWGKTVQYDLI